LLVVLGLLISVPIVIWGSTMMLGLVQRLPIIVYLGAAVLAWTAIKMATHEPYLAAWFIAYPAVTAALYMLAIVGVPYAGFVKNHRHLESRIHARLAQFAQQIKINTAASSAEGEKSMLRVLIPVDGSQNAQNAVHHAIKEYMKANDVEIHLLNVQPPFSRHIATFVPKRDRDAYHREQSEKALQPSRQILERFRVPYQTHTALGDRAKVITDTAHRLQCDHIVIGTARRNSLTRMLQDSVTNKVLEITTVPVEVVTGGEISRLERYGVPAAIATGLGLLLLALD
jgi:nucleotide-binding universal stress UspA family protein